MRSEKIRACMISAELAPWSQVGGLGAVVSSLSEALRQQGVDVRTITPLYPPVRQLPLAKLGELEPVRMGSRCYRAAVYVDVSRRPSVNVFIESHDFFDRAGVYVDPQSGQGYSDNFERFNFFCLAALQFLLRSNWKPQLLHCHDSHTALIPAYLSLDNPHPRIPWVPSLLTIHNLEYQGLCDAQKFALTGLSPSYFFWGGPFEFYGQLNLLKAGIEFADRITTVSPRYAQEIQTPEFGCGLEGVLSQRRNRLAGILNGIDTSEWSPESDPWIRAHFSSADLAGKIENKQALQRACGLPFRNVPLISTVSRLVEQKGFDLFLAIQDQLKQMDVQWVVLGQGARHYQQALSNLSLEQPGKFVARHDFEPELAHQIQAGSDMALMPSRFEPCGLSQMYAMRYGTAPIARRTGGLADTVGDFDPLSGQGTGFTFDHYHPGVLLECIKRAVGVWKNRDSWNRLVDNAMHQDFSWRKSARRYLELYAELTGGDGGSQFAVRGSQSV